MVEITRSICVLIIILSGNLIAEDMRLTCYYERINGNSASQAIQGVKNDSMINDVIKQDCIKRLSNLNKSQRNSIYEEFKICKINAPILRAHKRIFVGYKCITTNRREWILVSNSNGKESWKSDSGLVWHQPSNTSVNHYDAVKIASESGGGKRLPSIAEIKDAAETQKISEVMKIDDTSLRYWSSWIYKEDNSLAYFFNVYGELGLGSRMASHDLIGIWTVSK